MQEPPSKRGRGAVSGRGRKPGATVKNNKSPVAVKRKAPPTPGCESINFRLNGLCSVDFSNILVFL